MINQSMTYAVELRNDKNLDSVKIVFLFHAQMLQIIQNLWSQNEAAMRVYRVQIARDDCQDRLRV